MSVEQHNVDRVDLARRIIFMLHQEELKIFGRILKAVFTRELIACSRLVVPSTQQFTNWLTR